ncbi:hypothetical protein GPECTOR_49g502 [Gonium pectorale]|uniref:ubiquitinyl hydrolase 1 n=1 Tax=Gonium pectorale TaxID=33097 RepID=A0A150G7W9_GONPE|nr:hypothetical protein GPECTOR_49g502 [Gonium pectorale]|eukprot:KXZ45918.1 hypothetical protein GPECTOR_49g502 [Gonium pectorale]
MALAPKGHAQSLRLINKRFRLGRQEDSHEFLRCLLDAMHEACLKRFKPKPPPELVPTTFVYRIFAGKLRSQIECDGVDYVSRTYDPFLDLSLEINRAPSLERALHAFTAPEVLDGPNKYRCPKNNKLVRATKRISVEEAPNVLTVHLKRFEYGGFGAKINKKVEFGTSLDLRPYMSNTRGSAQLYDLYGVLVHHGHSVNSGHYICYVKAANGLWHVCDDHRVTAVGERTVLDQRAYILFYIRRQPRNAAAAAAATAVAQQAVQGAMRAAAAGAAAAAAGNGSTDGGDREERPAKRAKQLANGASLGANGISNGTAAVGAAPGSALAHMLANVAEGKHAADQGAVAAAAAAIQPQRLRVPKLKSKVQEQQEGQPSLPQPFREDAGPVPHVEKREQQPHWDRGDADADADMQEPCPSHSNNVLEGANGRIAALFSLGREHSPMRPPRHASAAKIHRPSPMLSRRYSSAWYAATGLLRHAAAAATGGGAAASGEGASASGQARTAHAGASGTPRGSLFARSQLARAQGQDGATPSASQHQERGAARNTPANSNGCGAGGGWSTSPAAAAAGEPGGLEAGCAAPNGVTNGTKAAARKRPRLLEAMQAEPMLANGITVVGSGVAAAKGAGQRRQNGALQEQDGGDGDGRLRTAEATLPKQRKHQTKQDEGAADRSAEDGPHPRRLLRQGRIGSLGNADGDGPSVSEQAAAPALSAKTKAAPGRQQQQRAEREESLVGTDALAWLTGGGAAPSFSGRQARGLARGEAHEPGEDGGWGDEDSAAQLRRQAAQLNREAAGVKRRIPTGGREYDEWDEEYDRGRMKKVRSKRDGDDDEDEGDGE